MDSREKIREIAKEKGIAIKDIAERIGMPKSTLYSFLQRDTGKIDISTIGKIARVLDVPITDLLVIPVIETEIDDDFIKWNKDYVQGAIDRTENRSQLLQHYDSMNDAGQSCAVATVKVLAEQPDFKPDPEEDK